MSRTVPAVGGGEQDNPDEQVRAVVRMLLAMRNERKDTLAGPLGISRSAVYAKMSGTSVFTVAEVIKMSRHFGIAPAVFLTGPQALFPTGVVSVGKLPSADRTRSGELARFSGVAGPRNRATPALTLLHGAAA